MPSELELGVLVLTDWSMTRVSCAGASPSVRDMASGPAMTEDVKASSAMTGSGSMKYLDRNLLRDTSALR